jgi:N-acetylmuramoyl-L-alanine amidase
MNSNFLYILDPGHGGIDPETGKYVTAGKRSPAFDDGSVLYEGENNREIVKLLSQKLEDVGIDAIDIVNSHVDISLNERVRRANELGRELKCVYISIHSDAYGNGKTWTSPSGISVYTSVGQTKSDDFSEHVLDEMKCRFGDSVKFRVDNSDGDQDKEAHFYVLRKTSMPAILIEGGFHTNKIEATRMLTKEWKANFTQAIVDAIQVWETIND